MPNGWDKPNLHRHLSCDKVTPITASNNTADSVETVESVRVKEGMILRRGKIRDELQVNNVDPSNAIVFYMNSTLFNIRPIPLEKNPSHTRQNIKPIGELRQRN